MCDLYGIPNCDTMKKARRWLDSNGVVYRFHDYKKEGVDAEQLAAWVEMVGWEVLLNRRGLTWRKLPDEDKSGLDQARAIELMIANPSMIKRPVLMTGGCIEVGFSEQAYAELFA